MTQALAWLATMLGLVSTWQCGRRHRMGWLLGIACCVVWVAVNVELRLWAGIASAGIAAGLSVRNWWAWR